MWNGLVIGSVRVGMLRPMATGALWRHGAHRGAMSFPHALERGLSEPVYGDPPLADVLGAWLAARRVILGDPRVDGRLAEGRDVGRIAVVVGSV